MNHAIKLIAISLLISIVSTFSCRKDNAVPACVQGEIEALKNFSCQHGASITEYSFQVALYAMHVKNAIADKAIWKRKVDMLKAVIADQNDFLGEFWGRDNTTDRLMKEKGYIPAAVSVAMCDELIGLTKAARYLTSQNAGWQKSYDMIVLSIND